MAEEYDFNYKMKFVIVGDSYVGKSCILMQFHEKRFRSQHEVTLGVDLASRLMEIDDVIVKLLVWDTAGQETFRSITRAYYRGAIGILLVYDITKRESFENLKKWLDEISQYANEKVRIILIGNKKDLEEKRWRGGWGEQISIEEGKQLADQNKLSFVETSAITGENIEFTFALLVKNVLLMINQKQIDLKNQNLGVQIGQQPGTKCSAQLGSFEEPATFRKTCCS